MSEHKLLAGESAHSPIAFVFADLSARSLAFSPNTGEAYLDTDIGRMCWQQSDNTYFLLIDTVPTWTGMGIVGADGRDGVDGAIGADGADGTNGTNGTDGTNGTNGTNGADGTDGAQGIQGIQGIQGTSGQVNTLVQGNGINIDSSDPVNPIITNTVTNTDTNIYNSDGIIDVSTVGRLVNINNSTSGKGLTIQANGNDGFSYISLEEQDINMVVENTNGFQEGFRLDATTGLMVNSSILFRGITYDADYAPNYTDRTLVDKAYVDNKVAAIDVGVTDVSSGTSISVDNTDPANPIINYIGVFGTEFEEFSSLPQSSTTSPNFQSKLSVTTAVKPAGKYRISFTVQVTNKKKEKGTEIEFRVDGVVQHTHSNGGNYVYHNILGDNGWVTESIVTYVTLVSPSTISLDTNYRREDDEARISDVRTEIWRVS